MTSTNMFSGNFADKPSSRVLKPPGGGQSNIFGPAEEPVKAPVPTSKKESQANEPQQQQQPTTAAAQKTSEPVKVQSEAKPVPPVNECRSYKHKLQGSSFNPITGEPVARSGGAEAAGENRQSNSIAVKQPPGGASTKLW